MPPQRSPPIGHRLEQAGLHNRGNAGNMFPATFKILAATFASWVGDPASQADSFRLEASQMAGRQPNICLRLIQMAGTQPNGWDSAKSQGLSQMDGAELTGWDSAKWLRL